MSESTIIFFLECCIIILLSIVLYQHFAFTKGIKSKLNEISEKISSILENDSDEKIMIFTDNKALVYLSTQINDLLLERQKIKIDYKKQELSSKKMLSNISHDIKTPLTVILGYLEIMRMNNEQDETLQKVEAKAKQVMELINQFFTLAKLEAGDMNVEIDRLNISELCRESVLGFYEILLQKDFEVEISIPEEDVFVYGNKEAVDRILNNLLSNLMRYGADGKYMGVFLRRKLQGRRRINAKIN